MKLSDDQIQQIKVILDEDCEVRTEETWTEFIISSALASMRVQMINQLINYRMALVVCVEDNLHLKLHIS